MRPTPVPLDKVDLADLSAFERDDILPDGEIIL